MKHIAAHFKRADPILASVSVPLEPITPGTNFFAALCEIIINQQVSSKAGEAIWQRFRKAAGTVTPRRVLATPDDTLRGAGLSRSKISYIRNVARHAIGNRLERLKDMEDAAVIAELTKIKGLGQWSAEMFLMFTLGREDVFSYGDLGLRNAIRRLYKFRHEPTKRQMEKLSRKWMPYRTYAARILWKSLEV